MAEALSKVNLLSFEGQRLSVLPRKSGASGSSLRFDSVGFRVKRLVHRRDDCSPRRGLSRSQFATIKAQTSFAIPKAQKWWEKDLKSNMKEVESAQELVDSLKNAGDKLVVVGFFSPSCGGCRALHPKLCQIAEANPDVQFLHVNYEEHKSMCYSLSVHVLPFFRFYRGAHGRLCSFSCTNATIKKFRDALAKHSTDRCSIEPVKGLEEKELVALASNRDLSFSYTPEPVKEAKPVPAPMFRPVPAGEAVSPAKQSSLSTAGQDSESQVVAV